MTSTLELWSTLLRMMLVLAPAEDPVARHGELATAMATVLAEERPLFSDDDSRERTAALVVAIAFRESSLRNDAVGDEGRSLCAMQIHGGSRELLEDPAACVRTGLRMLRASVRLDPANPVALYARGPRWHSEEARRISRDRTAVARSLLKGKRATE